MSTKNTITLVSVAIAVLCAGWAIYATRHANNSAAQGGMAPGAMGPPPMQQGSGVRRQSPGSSGVSGASSFGAGPVPVITRAALEESLVRELKALGTARANEAVEITAKSSNIVKEIHFRDGQLVKRGAVLVELDSAQTRADLAVASAALTESTSQYRRSRELLPTQALSTSQFEQIEATKNANSARADAARARLEDTVIRAPFSGRIGLRRVSVGSLINPGTVITTLDDASLIKIDFPVPESNLTALRAGLDLSAESSAYPGRRFAGTVASVDSRIDPVSRTVLVRAEVPNPEGLLKPGMFLNVELKRDQRTAIVISEESLVPDQTRQYVFVVKAGRAEKREVKIGARRPGSVEILQGIKVGERIVVEGTVKLRDAGLVRDLAQ